MLSSQATQTSLNLTQIKKPDEELFAPVGSLKQREEITPYTDHNSRTTTKKKEKENRKKKRIKRKRGR